MRCMGTVFVLINVIVCDGLVVDEFYSFGESVGDRSVPRNDDRSSDEVSLTFPFPFFGDERTSLWINTNGAISFDAELSDYKPRAFPLDSGSATKLIAPFWADVDTRSNGGLVYYRESTNPSLLRRATGDVRRNFPIFSDFTARWLILATWHNVNCYNCNANKPRNTFQCVLITDGKYSFAEFLYANISWSITTSQSSHAQIGFDAGNGQNYYSINGSLTENVRSVADRSNFQPFTNGVWIFRIDDAQITGQHCDQNGAVAFDPPVVGQLGEEVVNISGPCFDANVTVRCVFDDPTTVNESEGEVISRDLAVCKTPAFAKTGYVAVTVRMTKPDGAVESKVGKIYVVDFESYPSYTAVSIIQSGRESRAPLLADPSHPVSVKWTPVTTATGGPVSHVDIEIIVYEPINGGLEFLRAIPLATNVSNNGNHEIQEFLGLQEGPVMGFVRIKAADALVARRKRFVGSIIRYAKTQVGKVVAWASRAVNKVRYACDEWHQNEGPPPSDIQPPCAPTAALANQDPRFVPDPACQKRRWLPQYLSCFFHSGKSRDGVDTTPDFCNRGIIRSSSGGGQQCCYKDGRLVTGPPSGGTIDRVHSDDRWGHFKTDVLPAILCCQLKLSRSPDTACEKYFEKRPSDTGQDYTPPVLSGARGDPHITTFDGLDYTFNGAGEFWLVRTGNEQKFEMQARMEPFHDENGVTRKATVFTAFCFKDGGHKIEVFLDQVGGARILANEKTVDVSQDVLLGQQLNGVWLFVTKSSGLVNGLSLNFASGFGFDIRVNAKLLSITCMASQMWKGIISKAEESLFTYRPGESHSKFYKPNFLPEFQVPTNISQEVKDKCRNEPECLFDSATTGDLEIGLQTRAAATDLRKALNISSDVPGTCPTVQAPENGYIGGVNKVSFVGEEKKFLCNDGYKLKGPQVIICSKDTKWDKSPPICSSSSDSACPLNTIMLLFFAIATVGQFS